MMENESFSRDELGGIVRAPETIGSPIKDAIYTPGPQERVDTCAIRSQQHILAMYGIDIPEADLVQDAIKHEEYSMSDTNGTSIDDVGNLLERHGVDVNRYDNATIAHLISELGQGHKIIVGIDAYEVIADSLPERMVEMQKDAVMERANHAVLVVDVDPRTLDVAIIDPADGRLHSVPVGRFIDAWQDSECFMMATKESPEEFIAENGSELGGTTMMHDFDKHNFPMSHVAGVDPQNTGVNQPRLGSLGQVVGASPRLGSLGQVAGFGFTTDEMNHLLNGLETAGSQGAVAIDLTGNGAIDALAFDTDGNGMLDTLALDANSDGVMDTFATSVDLNGDGIPDVVGVDLNGDGIIDCAVDPDDFSTDY